MLIHIGYRKSASTFLQARVFGDPDGPFRMIDPRQPSLTELTYTKGVPYDVRRAKLAFKTACEEIVAAGKYPVLSHERYAGRSSHAPRQLDTLSARLETMNRLVELAPEAKILIIIREQRSAQLSAYKHYVRRGGGLSLEQYSSPEYRTDGFDQRNHYLYHELIEAYQTAFGLERVLVLPFEQLRSDANGMVTSLIEFCGLQPWRDDWARFPAANAGPNETALAIKRSLNQLLGLGLKDNVMGMARFSKSVHFGLARGLRGVTDRGLGGLNRKLRSKALSRLAAINENYFADSNRITQELTGLPLREYGYKL